MIPYLLLKRPRLQQYGWYYHFKHCVLATRVVSCCAPHLKPGLYSLVGTTQQNNFMAAANNAKPKTTSYGCCGCEEDSVAITSATVIPKPTTVASPNLACFRLPVGGCIPYR